MAFGGEPLLRQRERERGRVEETAGASEGRRGTSAFRSKLPGEANTNKQRRGAEEAGREGRGRKGEEGKAANAVPGKLKEAFYWIVFFFFLNQLFAIFMH